jgi:hypothetical protein
MAPKHEIPRIVPESCPEVEPWHVPCSVQLVETSKRWIEKGARFGHFTKGVLYGLIGGLALQVSLGAGGRVAGGEDAARFVGHQPFGQVLLILIAAGLFGYAAWRFIEGINDTEHKGSDGQGLAQRAGALGSGVVNAALGVVILQMALGQSSGGDGGSSWVAKLLAQPFGPALVAAIGAGIVITGVVQFYQAYSKKFLEMFRWHAMSARERRWVTRMGQVGYSARGVVFPIIGVSLLRAALDRNASQTRDMREALLEIAHSTAGQVLLGLVAVGFLAFGLFMVASARYRQMPC